MFAVKLAVRVWHLSNGAVPVPHTFDDRQLSPSKNSANVLHLHPVVGSMKDPCHVPVSCAVVKHVKKRTLKLKAMSGVKVEIHPP